MSWQRAREDAEQWIDTMNLPDDLRGEYIDLVPLSDSLPFEGNYKKMVMQAAARILKSKGATANFNED